MTDLENILTFEAFEKAYSYFLNQADDNFKTKKSRGQKAPFGIEPPAGSKVIVGAVDGGNLGNHFGQGAASRAPYFNWHVVSIYYDPRTGNIVVGIQLSRYTHVKEMKNWITRELPTTSDNKIAAFYSTNKSSLDYKRLYDEFMKVCLEVQKLGL